MASDSEFDAPHANIAVTADGHATSIFQPTTPQETGPQISSQVTLPSTEVPGSPIDPNQSFKTEVNDDRPAVTVIPSSLTPPPSTQVGAKDGTRRVFSNSQQSALFSPPATILNRMRERDIASDYAPPAPHQVLEASADELRAMLQTCIAEHQKLKMEAAHHKLQYNLLSLQADEESKRAAVEHDMVRREVDALRMAEHSRLAKRELSATSDSIHSKYLHIKSCYESAIEENDTLNRRVKVAKKVIQQKEEETVSLMEEREMLLNRIRENREHFHMLCSPGGIFHGALTPKQIATPQQLRATPRQTPRTLQRGESDGREHGLSALLEAMSQDNSNNSAPTTPMVMARPAPRQVGRHQRNAQSMSSLPTTPLNKPRGDYAGLLPSVNLVAQTEPRPRYSQKQFVPTTPPSKRHMRRKSRESTISADDNEELARQALESVKAVQSLASQSSRSIASGSLRRDGGSQDGEEEIYGSQASQAATEMLRRHASRSFEAASSQDGSADKAASMHAKLFPGAVPGIDKRKFSGSNAVEEEARREHASPVKKLRAGTSTDGRRVGLGIQYGE